MEFVLQLNEVMDNKDAHFICYVDSNNIAQDLFSKKSLQERRIWTTLSTLVSVLMERVPYLAAMEDYRYSFAANPLMQYSQRKHLNSALN